MKWERRRKISRTGVAGGKALGPGRAQLNPGTKKWSVWLKHRTRGATVWDEAGGVSRSQIA